MHGMDKVRTAIPLYSIKHDNGTLILKFGSSSSSDIIILLISFNDLNSEYCFN